MTIRRDVLRQSLALAGLLAGCAELPLTAPGANRAAFDARTLAEVYQRLGLPLPELSASVVLLAPEIAEDGAVVPVSLSTRVPGAHSLILLADRNPTPLLAVFELSPHLDGSLNTRVKLAQTCEVYGVVLTHQRQVFYAQRTVKVTLGGCGG